jgi:hypothetical protein
MRSKANLAALLATALYFTLSGLAHAECVEICNNSFERNTRAACRTPECRIRVDERYSTCMDVCNAKPRPGCLGRNCSRER